jgi:hypothetical protein
MKQHKNKLTDQTMGSCFVAGTQLTVFDEKGSCAIGVIRRFGIEDAMQKKQAP